MGHAANDEITGLNLGLVRSGSKSLWSFRPWETWVSRGSINPRCSSGTRFWVPVSDGYTPKCAEQRSPQGTWYCCLPTHGHKPSRNPSVVLLLVPGKAGDVSGAGWDGPQPQYCLCSSPAVLAEIEAAGISVLSWAKLKNWLQSHQKTPGLQTCPARNRFLPWTNKHVLLTRWR